MAPYDESTYVLDTDTTLGAVLQQGQDGQLCVIGYASCALLHAGRRYCVMRKELLGIMYGLNLEILAASVGTAHHRLHKPCCPYLSHEDAGSGWISSEYDITIQHCPGWVHRNSDALS